MGTYESELGQILQELETYRELMKLYRSENRERMVAALVAVRIPVDVHALLAIDKSRTGQSMLRATALAVLNDLAKRGIVKRDGLTFEYEPFGLEVAIRKEQERAARGKWTRRRKGQWKREVYKPEPARSVLCRCLHPRASCPSCVAKRRHALGMTPLERGAIKRPHAPMSQLCTHTFWVNGCPCCMKRGVWWDEHTDYQPPYWWNVTTSDRYKWGKRSALSQVQPGERERTHEQND